MSPDTAAAIWAVGLAAAVVVFLVVVAALVEVFFVVVDVWDVVVALVKDEAG